MKTNWSLPTPVLIVCAAVVLVAAPLAASDSQTEANTKAEAEMKAAFGTVPVMMRVYPDHLRATAWAWFAATMSPDAPIPTKYSELISLAVASQIPCDYCIYAHTTMAKMFGATDAEIRAAIAAAANTRHWSTVLNGAEVPLDDFKKEWDGILEYLRQSAAK